MLPKLKSDSVSVFVHKILTLDPKKAQNLAGVDSGSVAISDKRCSRKNGPDLAFHSRLSPSCSAVQGAVSF